MRRLSLYPCHKLYVFHVFEVSLLVAVAMLAQGSLHVAMSPRRLVSTCKSHAIVYSIVLVLACPLHSSWCASMAKRTKASGKSASSSASPSGSAELFQEIAPHGTRSGLAATLVALKKRGWLKDEVADEVGSEDATRKKIKEGMEAHSKVKTPYGRVVQTMNLCPKLQSWEFCHPLCLLHHLSTISVAFAELMHNINTSVTKPLRIVLYVDACEPGNPLRPDEARKLECIYWTFLEMPQWLLQRSGAWFVFGFLRTKEMSKHMLGGVSELMGRVLKVFFCPDNNGHCFGRGVTCVYKEARHIVTAIFGGFLADDEAHTYMMGLKGASGSV